MQNQNTGTSGTQQPSKKVDSDLNKKPDQKQGERISKEPDFNSPQRSK